MTRDPVVHLKKDGGFVCHVVDRFVDPANLSLVLSTEVSEHATCRKCLSKHKRDGLVRPRVVHAEGRWTKTLCRYGRGVTTSNRDEVTCLRCKAILSTRETGR